VSDITWYLFTGRYIGCARGAAALLLLSVTLTAGLTALSIFIAYVLEHQFAFTAVTSFLVLPVVFVSNGFVPTSLMPGWLATVAELNPVSVTITGTGARRLDRRGPVAGSCNPRRVRAERRRRHRRGVQPPAGGRVGLPEGTSNR